MTAKKKKIDQPVFRSKFEPQRNNTVTIQYFAWIK